MNIRGTLFSPFSVFLCSLSWGVFPIPNALCSNPYEENETVFDRKERQEREAIQAIREERKKRREETRANISAQIEARIEEFNAIKARELSAKELQEIEIGNQKVIDSWIKKEKKNPEESKFRHLPGEKKKTRKPLRALTPQESTPKKEEKEGVISQTSKGRFKDTVQENVTVENKTVENKTVENTSVENQTYVPTTNEQGLDRAKFELSGKEKKQYKELEMSRAEALKAEQNIRSLPQSQGDTQVLDLLNQKEPSPLNSLPTSQGITEELDLGKPAKSPPPQRLPSSNSKSTNTLEF